ncbi:hypothetical protein Tco_0474797 [Tanacetum coccineum]
MVIGTKAFRPWFNLHDAMCRVNRHDISVGSGIQRVVIKCDSSDAAIIINKENEPPLELVDIVGQWKSAKVDNVDKLLFFLGSWNYENCRGLDETEMPLKASQPS